MSPFSSTAVLDRMSGVLGYTRAYRPMALFLARGEVGTAEATAGS